MKLGKAVLSGAAFVSRSQRKIEPIYFCQSTKNGSERHALTVINVDLVRPQRFDYAALYPAARGELHSCGNAIGFETGEEREAASWPIVVQSMASP